MLNVIHQALETLLRVRGQIDSLDVDVSFDVPTEDRIASLGRPTVDLFLFDVGENTDKRETNPQLNINGGRAERRMPPRRIDLWYMVSVLTTDVGDEHVLLWRVLATLLKYEQFPPEVLPDALQSLPVPMTGRLANADETRNLVDIWSALGTSPRPALCYVLTAPLDLALSIDGPLVLTRTARYRQIGSGAVQSGRPVVHIGGIVRDASGRPLPAVRVLASGSALGAVTDIEGRYALRGLPEGRVTLHIARDGGSTRKVQVEIPSESYDIVLDG
jgi:hypothetical protein